MNTPESISSPLDDSDPCTPSDSKVDTSPIANTNSGSNKRKEVMALPLPPGTLPPRKRAKTKDEKEQRRVERIMRNRQAAHASREKKRKHVEELEKKCVTLTSDNEALEAQVKEAKKTEGRMIEQQYLLMNKLQEIQTALSVAKASGDLASLDIDKLTAPVAIVKDSSISSNSSDCNGDSILNSPVIKEQSSCASPESLILSTFTAPSLSSSVSSSPFNSSEEMDLGSGGDLYSLFDSSLDSKTHHPAAMVPSGLQRRSMNYLKSLSMGLSTLLTVVGY